MLSNALSVLAIETLEPTDFQLESWNKDIDFFDYVRTYDGYRIEYDPTYTAYRHLISNELTPTPLPTETPRPPLMPVERSPWLYLGIADVIIIIGVVAISRRSKQPERSSGEEMI